MSTKKTDPVFDAKTIVANKSLFDSNTVIMNHVLEDTKKWNNNDQVPTFLKNRFSKMFWITGLVVLSLGALILLVRMPDPSSVVIDQRPATARPTTDGSTTADFLAALKNSIQKNRTLVQPN